MGAHAGAAAVGPRGGCQAGGAGAGGTGIPALVAASLADSLALRSVSATSSRSRRPSALRFSGEKGLSSAGLQPKAKGRRSSSSGSSSGLLAAALDCLVCARKGGGGGRGRCA